MTKANEWKSRGASLTVEQASLEFDIHHDFICNAINVGQLECRSGTTGGRHWTKILRVQLIAFIGTTQAGALHLARIKAQADLQQINKNIACLKKMVEEFQNKKIELEKWLTTNPMLQ